MYNLLIIKENQEKVKKIGSNGNCKQETIEKIRDICQERWMRTYQIFANV